LKKVPSNVSLENNPCCWCAVPCGIKVCLWNTVRSASHNGWVHQSYVHGYKSSITLRAGSFFGCGYCLAKSCVTPICVEISDSFLNGGRISCFLLNYLPVFNLLQLHSAITQLLNWIYNTLVFPDVC
jgi:hypothetical protein